jgi:hypothetical protein
MKPEELKFYNKYKHINKPNKELIYIGVDNDGDYWFLYKNKDHNSSFSYLKHLGLNPEQIVKDLNLETVVYSSGDKYIKGCDYEYYSITNIKMYLKPILKDKLKNIINR